MTTVTRTGNILQIGENYRIEPGPRLVKAVADDNSLSDDVTARHYHAPVPATPEEIANPAVETSDGFRYARDARGARIVPGLEFAYLDWLGVQNSIPGSLVWYVYERGPLSEQEREAGHTGSGDGTIYREIACEDSEETALALVFSRLTGGN